MNKETYDPWDIGLVSSQGSVSFSVIEDCDKSLIWFVGNLFFHTLASLRHDVTKTFQKAYRNKAVGVFTSMSVFSLSGKMEKEKSIIAFKVVFVILTFHTFHNGLSKSNGTLWQSVYKWAPSRWCNRQTRQCSGGKGQLLVVIQLHAYTDSTWRWPDEILKSWKMKAGGFWVGTVKVSFLGNLESLSTQR